MQERSMQDWALDPWSVGNERKNPASKTEKKKITSLNHRASKWPALESTSWKKTIKEGHLSHDTVCCEPGLNHQFLCLTRALIEIWVKDGCAPKGEFFCQYALRYAHAPLAYRSVMASWEQIWPQWINHSENGQFKTIHPFLFSTSFLFCCEHCLKGDWWRGGVCLQLGTVCAYFCPRIELTASLWRTVRYLAARRSRVKHFCGRETTQSGAQTQSCQSFFKVGSKTESS